VRRPVVMATLVLDVFIAAAGCGADKPPNKPMSDHVWERLEEEQRRLGTVTKLAV